MKRVIVGIGLFAALAATVAAQMPKYGVTVNAEKNVDFAKFKTYTWTTGQPAQDNSPRSPTRSALPATCRRCPKRSISR